MREKIGVVVSLICIGVIARLVPHPWNMTPVTSLVMLSSLYFGWRYSVGILFGTMLVTDFFIGFYQWQIMCAVYISFGLAAVLGYFIKNRKSAFSVGVTSVVASVLFFIITNWAVWYFGSMYDHSFHGLMESYVMGLPFFRNALVGDMAYSLVLFGVFELVRAQALSYAGCDSSVIREQVFVV